MPVQQLGVVYDKASTNLQWVYPSGGGTETDGSRLSAVGFRMATTIVWFKSHGSGSGFSGHSCSHQLFLEPGLFRAFIQAKFNSQIPSSLPAVVCASEFADNGLVTQTSDEGALFRHEKAGLC